MCILSLWVSSLFEGNRELSCASGTREEAREPRIVSSPLACSLACYRAPRLACHSKWRALFYVSLNSINCIVVSSLLFSPSIYKYCFVICLQLPPPRLVYRLFAGGKVNVINYFPIFNKICCLLFCCESLLSGFCILSIFLSTFPMTFMRWMCHLLIFFSQDFNFE